MNEAKDASDDVGHSTSSPTQGERISHKLTLGWGYHILPKRPHPLPLFAGSTIAFWLVIVAGRYFGPAVIVLLSMLVCMGVAGLHAWRWLRGTRSPTLDLELVQEDRSARIQVSGTLREISDLYGIVDEAFEPIIFQQLYRVWVLLVGCLGSIAVIYCAVFVVKWTADTMLFGLLLGQAIFLAAWFFEQIFPLYYRIIPGKMEVLRFAPLAGKGTVVRSWDLKTVQIRVRCNKRRIEIERQPGLVDRLMFFKFAEPYTFARAVLQGAVSTHNAPPLPQDQLLG